jgi:hypothetical protein
VGMVGGMRKWKIMEMVEEQNENRSVVFIG